MQIGQETFKWVTYSVVAVLLFSLATLLARIAWHLVQGIRGKEPLSIFPDMTPPLRLTYTVPKAYARYCEERDGWKGEAVWLKPIALGAFLMSFVLPAGGLHWPSISTFLYACAGFGILFFTTRFLSKNFDHSISFYKSGIGNRPKGKITPYTSYEKVLIRRVTFQKEEFFVVNFIPKKRRWIPASEFGFSLGTDVAPLLELLKSQGLPVEEAPSSNFKDKTAPSVLR